MDPKTNIEAVELHDLLTDLDNPDPPPESHLANWLKSEGYFPGSTPTSCLDLHAAYKRWMALNVGDDAPIMRQRTFGAELTMRFRKKRLSDGIYYFISRDAIPKIPKNIGSIQDA